MASPPAPVPDKQVPPQPPSEGESETQDDKRKSKKKNLPARKAGKPKRYADASTSDSDPNDYDYQFSDEDRDSEYKYQNDDAEEVYGFKLQIKKKLAAKPKITKPPVKPKPKPAAVRRAARGLPLGPGGIPLPNLPPFHQQTIMGAPASANGIRLTTDQEMEYMARMHAQYGTEGVCQAIRNLGGIA